MSALLAALATLAHRRHRRVIVVAVVLAVAAAAFGGPVASVLESGHGDFGDPASPSQVAAARVERATGAEASPGIVVTLRPGAPVRTPAGRAEIARATRLMAADPGVARVASFAGRPDPSFVSRDGRTTWLAAWVRNRTDGADAAARLEHRLGPRATVGGSDLANQQVGDTVSSDLGRAEMLAFPILFLLSLWVFRGLVAALLPLLVGGIAIVVTFSALRIGNGVVPLSVFAVNLVTGLGLGLAIDYSLFVVSRYREELARTGPGLEALRRTMAGAGRTVLFSSLTVAASAAALLVFPQRFLYSMGFGGMVCALAAMVVALVVLPAVLAALGPRVNALAPARWQRAAAATARAEQRGGWYRLAQGVMRRPGLVAALSATLLVVLALPALGVRFTSVGASVLPRTESARQVGDALERDFPSDRTSPTYAVVSAPRGARREVAGIARRMDGVAGVRAVAPPAYLGRDTWRIDAFIAPDTFSAGAKRVVRDLRALPTAAPARVGGEAAAFTDQQASLAGHLGPALAIVVVATLIVLFAMTGSVVLPVKALLMNALTIGATFGLLVLVFQDGRLERLLGYTSQGALDATQPILICAIAFGLSTDYGVFLLSRIKEARDRGAGERASVATGLERTGRIVTAAALLFCIAIGAFATSSIVFIKEVGLGTAAAVAIDATIVRALLVPALMALLGRWNWWAPRPLRRLHRVIGLREEGVAA